MEDLPPFFGIERTQRADLNDDGPAWVLTFQGHPILRSEKSPDGLRAEARRVARLIAHWVIDQTRAKQ